VDGGVVSPVAVDAARRLGADVVIAVDITAGAAGVTPDMTLDTIFQSINVMYAKIAAVQLSRADVVIQPKVGHIASGDFTKRHEAILEGETAAQAALPKIQALLGETVKK
jgi:NTE family protein